MKPYLKILQEEPAPSPYSGILSTDVFEIDGNPLKWKVYWLDPANREDDSRIMLVDADNTPWLILNYGCYIKRIDNSKVLLWYSSSKPETREYFIAIFNLADLLPINMEKALEVLTEETKSNPKDNPLSTVSYGYYANFKNEPVSFRIPNKLTEGKNPYKFPEGFEIEEDVIIHGYYAVKSHDYGEDYYNPWINPFCILIIRSKKKEIEVISVDWFNTSEWDLNYQWITRIARDSKTQKFLAEGFRIGIFRLDKSGKNLDKWIIKDDFYFYPSLDPIK